MLKELNEKKLILFHVDRSLKIVKHELFDRKAKVLIIVGEFYFFSVAFYLFFNLFFCYKNFRSFLFGF